MNARTWLLFGGASVLWGVPYLFIEMSLREGIGPITTAAGRVVLAAAALLPAALSSNARQLIRLRFGRLAVLAVVEVVIPFSMISLGGLTVSSGLSGIIIATEPIFVLLIIMVLSRRAPTSAAALLGVAVGFGGVVVLLGVDGAGPGAVLVLVASASYALGAVLVGRWFSDVPPLRVVSSMILLAAPILIAIAISVEPLPAPTWTGLGAVAALGLACTAGGFWTFFTLIAHADATRAALITYVAPIVAVAAGALLLDERIGVRTVFGIALIFVGAALATRRTEQAASTGVVVEPEPDR
ncbi:hypothetical protein AD006_27145 [Pseudonocardia sp. EC080610-09]|uniref:DMT family transporter n=1 Tax=unclassified Pseudonocardia TaxID=2619320 RepID=UPI00070696CE|nr:MULTISPECIES: DMT family transporter [unclassified Pseudonocardia]ALL78062.1 hypothetical protein AD006_27145 [Pseudonocardia sp. EC080610-09]ALL80973.1 hypothetical protein AD017_06740 [Pseudonocardia sp. EC080619-01]